MIRDWILSKLEGVKGSSRVLVRDYLQLLPKTDSGIHGFASANGYTVIVASTNLVFRELYERATADPGTKKLLLIDRTPVRRRNVTGAMSAPPPFYPDLLERIPEEARLDLDLRQILKETTGDQSWPLEANDPRYARLIVKHLPGVLRAYQNLRRASRERFTDHDFKTIVAFAALGVADGAFKKLEAEAYWRIGLLGRDALDELESLAPEVTRPIKDELLKASAPFCWFGTRDPDSIIRAFYLSLVLAQHVKDWNLLLANIDPALATLSGIGDEILREAGPKLVVLDPHQAERDLDAVEDSLAKETLQLLLVDQIRVTDPAGFAGAIERERYSTLVRSLALLLALDNLLSNQPAREEQGRIAAVLFPEGHSGEIGFVEKRSSITWSHLKEAYGLARDIQSPREELAKAVKALNVTRGEGLSFKLFREMWNERRLNRLEYYLSALDRLIDSGDFLPRTEEALPSVFSNALDRIRQRLRLISDEVNRQLDEVNRRFQELVEAQYPSWIAGDTEVRLTSHFLRRCLKPHWDPEKERAVVFVFDGMRYDIWDELLRPMLESYMEVIDDMPASSLIPSETEISRWAIAAGAEPDTFWPRKAENAHLKDSLVQEFNYKGEVEVVNPEGSGTGVTVRYKADNLDYYIFEFCDKELHGIQMKSLPDGRKVPGRPLSFVYQQHLKNIIDTEVMAIVRRLAPGTKVFVTADHGFGPVGRNPLWFSEADLNEASDCSYLNCWLRVAVDKASLPVKARDNIVAFTPDQLRLFRTETRTTRKTGDVFHKEYEAVVFPRVGFSFSRQGSHYNPDAYTHGGISLQELMIPMVALRVKPRDEGLLLVEPIIGPKEVVEGEEVEFRTPVIRTALGNALPEDLRIEVEATYSRDPDRFPLARQVLYLSSQGSEAVNLFRPNPDDATDEERREGYMKRTLTVTVSWREGRRLVRKAQTHHFAVRLNSEQVIRRVGNLGNILGLTPKSMR
jgi:PglZ domain